jgi:glucans biosynthesis protein C
MDDRALPARRYDLDWLRVLAILLLLFFHTAMIFVAEWDWHIKNAETSNLLLEFNFFLSRWRMALLFLISGIGTSYALGFRTGNEYLRERAKRLLVPLVFGILVIVPPQIYMERLVQGQEYSSYLAFYPSVFEGRPYPAGSTSWHHLWFVAYLLIYSVVLLPVFLWMRTGPGRRAATSLEQLLGRTSIYALGAPLAVVLAALWVKYPGPQNVVQDWAFLLYYLIIFAYGFMLSRAETLWRQIEDRRRASLTFAVLAILGINHLRWNGLSPEVGYSSAFLLYMAALAFNAWFWVLAILGYAKRYLNFRNRFLDYANEGIYPFYILHQTVIVIVGFYVVQVQESVLAKFVFTSLVSLALTVAIYDLFVKPYRVTRFLFGMKSARTATPAREGEVGREGPVRAPRPLVGMREAVVVGSPDERGSPAGSLKLREEIDHGDVP